VITTSLTHAKTRLSELVDVVGRSRERVVLTRHGSPVAVLLSPEELEGLEETIAVLSDLQSLPDLLEARWAISRGHLTEIDDVTLRTVD